MTLAARSLKVTQRLDVLLTRRGLIESRQRAHALILAGKVQVSGATERRPDRAVREDEVITVDESPGYASRGALKLGPALDRFGVDPSGRVCADIGASTGGFTDVLLRRGAVKVFAIDVGRGLIHWRLRQDPRVVVIERVNARDLESSEVGKGGIVRDPLVVESALQRFRTWCGGHGYQVAGEAASQLTGAEGNQEYFFHLSPK